MSAATLDQLKAIADRMSNNGFVGVAEETRKYCDAVAKVTAERDALLWALSEYPKRNRHQLQARKVCEGVAALARVGAAP